MSKIEIMSEDLTNKIAAGEVAQNIANVVKELVENSIDADAKNIKIELIDAGTKEIKVTDDGSGMDEKDALNAFSRHATSKLKKPDDLFFISTLGFRGEALPSIASVSKVKLITSEGTMGTTVIINGGKLISQNASDARKGTSIIINDLFYNTPARLKYLKSDQTELANTTTYIEKLSLSYPNISFYLSNNDKQIISTTGSNDLLKTIYEIYGSSISKEMILINSSNDDFDLYGFICKPSILKSTKNYITTIVNGRVVRNADLIKTIDEAYHTYKPDGKYPIVILQINTDPTLIDVNIHPTKQDIKFSKIDTLKDLIMASIKQALYDSLLIPKVEVKTINQKEIPIQKINEDFNYEINIDTKISEPQIEYNNTLDFTKENNEEIKKLELYPCGLVMGTYIVAENDNAMYLIDQHAAQERINYERILKALKTKEISITSMLIPISVELSPSDYIKFIANKDNFEKLGFVIEDFGINTIMVKAHPTWLLTGYEEEQTRQIMDLIINIPKDFDAIKFNDHVAATAACKMSVKGNERTTLEEAKKLLEDLVLCDNPYNCPHGRPTIITFTRYELERMFKRVMN